MSIDTEWFYKNEPFLNAPEGYYGFVYCITNLITRRSYIGRKYFWSIRKVKGKKRRQTFESDWKNYYGSSKEVQAEISLFGKENFHREILFLCKTKGQTNYGEIRLQFALDVLYSQNANGVRNFYNKNILSRYFAPSDAEYEKLLEEFKNSKEKTIHNLEDIKSDIQYWLNLTEEQRLSLLTK